MLRFMMIAVMMTGLSGCMTPAQWVDSEVGANQPADYKLGYLDGCPSGKKATGDFGSRFTKDVSRYGTDALYKQGWDDGYSVCKAKSENLNRMLGPVY